MRRGRAWSPQQGRLGRVGGTLVGLVLAASSVACTSTSTPPTVTIFTPEIGDELALMQRVLTAYGEEHGITIEIEGTRDFESLIESQVEAGDPPDIGMYPQPGTIQTLAADLEVELAPLSADDQARVRDNADPAHVELVTGDAGAILAVPVKADVKSLVWYSPTEFARHGYAVPSTFQGLLDLVQRMVAEGDPAFCAGIRSGEASGWPLTDWIEDFLLRMEGPELYDRWVAHEIPFDDPRVVAVAQTVIDLWHQEGVLYGGPEAAAVTDFADVVLPVLDGECMMVRGANFQGVNWPEDTTFGPQGQIDAFRLPGSPEHPDIALSGGLFAVPFAARDEVGQVMSYLASDAYARDAIAAAYGGGDPLARAGSFLAANETPAGDADDPGVGEASLALYDRGRARDGGLTRDIARARDEADPVRFDASDLMPPEVGSGAFWAAAVDLTLGREDVATAFAEVEDAWPT